MCYPFFNRKKRWTFNSSPFSSYILSTSIWLPISNIKNYNLVYFGVEKSYLVIGSPLGKLNSKVFVTRSE